MSESTNLRGEACDEGPPVKVPHRHRPILFRDSAAKRLVDGGLVNKGQHHDRRSNSTRMNWTAALYLIYLVPQGDPAPDGVHGQRPNLSGPSLQSTYVVDRLGAVSADQTVGLHSRHGKSRQALG